MGNSPLSGQGVSESHERDVQGVESTDGRPNKLAEENRDNPSNPTPSHNYMRALKIYGIPIRPRLRLPKELMGFCSDRSHECAYRIRSS